MGRGRAAVAGAKLRRPCDRVPLLTEPLDVAVIALDRLLTTHLRKVPCIGPITSLAFVLTLEDPKRFGRSRHVGAYLGLTPGQRQPGNSHHVLGITKQGDNDVRQLLVQCSQRLLGPLGTDCGLRRWGLEHIDPTQRRSRPVTVVATARKLAVLLHHLWLTGEVYQPFYQAKEGDVAA